MQRLPESHVYTTVAHEGCVANDLKEWGVMADKLSLAKGQARIPPDQMNDVQQCCQVPLFKSYKIQ